IEEKPSNEVRKSPQHFDTSSSRQISQVLNEIEKRKQTEVSRLANELRTSLDQFKETNLKRLAELDAFISMADQDDEIQLDYVKFELNSVTKKIDSLHFNIIVQVIDKSNQRASSTALTRYTLELVKVFEFKKPKSISNQSSFLDPVRNFFRHTSTNGASYYNTDVFGQQKH
ncbi:unnamed protein product, partial [Rotaria sp. Silwood2]